MFANHTSLLHRAIWVDAIGGVTTGLLAFVAANWLGNLLALPEALLRPIGLFLIVFGAVLGYLASRTVIPRGAAWALIIFNALWVVASVALLLSDLVSPNALGYAFVIVQALLVGGLAEAQFMGVRQTARAAAVA